MAQLQGLSYDKASLFGMPNVNAKYTSYECGDYRLDEGSVCPICGQRCTNVHHIVPRSARKRFFLGGIMLRSPLFGLCGSGTTGCHNGFHGGARYLIRWEWDSEERESEWWSGEILKSVEPHDNALFGMGRYVLTDRLAGRDFVLRRRTR